VDRIFDTRRVSHSGSHSTGLRKSRTARSSDPWSVGLWHLSRVSGSRRG
jgi:hypothetical protein